jgi:Transcriptional regulator, AbiEi antitoxin/Protein of unknown function (DUF559)
LATRQHGVVERGQLVALGVSVSAIDRRLRRGWLIALHPGVYAVGHKAVSRQGRWLAAVLWGGPGAVLSHLSAAALWGLLKDGPGVEISSLRRTRSQPGVRRHRNELLPMERTLRHGIPVTSLARTLLDVASAVSVPAMETAIREAEYRHRFLPGTLAATLIDHRGQRGARTAWLALESIGFGPQGRVRSGLETRFAALVVRSHLPPPELNVLLDVGGKIIEADCLWRSQRLIVELDGRAAHGTHSAFEKDRERDRRIQVAGWRVVRVTSPQLANPQRLIQDLHALLQAEFASSPGT